MGKAAEWLISKDPILLGSDNFPVEVSPNLDPKLSGPVHQIALVINGVHLLENLKARYAWGNRNSGLARRAFSNQRIAWSMRD